MIERNHLISEGREGAQSAIENTRIVEWQAVNYKTDFPRDRDGPQRVGCSTSVKIEVPWLKKSPQEKEADCRGKRRSNQRVDAVQVARKKALQVTSRCRRLVEKLFRVYREEAPEE